ncbi:protein SLOW GREEN 1, chloroplastic [Morus notabilis]|uniref:protein SLOW GREEN 1, chloroplastic n=1 Tax=Morus notabilis TaxID=981085 RepID=UPI000CED40FE|nr:protein SLOW GREEN 1, chloroplastic [Morus notabilis]
MGELPSTSIAAPVAPPPPTEERIEESSENDEQERASEEQVSRDPDDAEALRSLMEAKIKANKLDEVVQVLDRLIELEPEDLEWPLLKANIHSHNGELELTKSEFEAILEKDPLRVEAYHGLVMAASQSGEKLNGMVRRVEGRR